MELRHTETHPEVDEAKALTLADHLQSDTFKRHLEAILPKHLSTERFASIAMRQLSQVPKLQECSLRSVVGGIMEAATLGLEIGTQGEAWLIPYAEGPKDNRHLEAQLQVGVWGYAALAWRSGKIQDVQMDIVLPGDEFSFQKGSASFLHHKPRGERDFNKAEGTIEWVYAVVRTLEGGTIFDAFDALWVERIRAKSKSPNSPAWVNFYAEMAMAKALKRVLKLAPKSRELARAIVLDDLDDTAERQVFDIDTSHLLPAGASANAPDEKAGKATKEALRKPRAKTAKAGPEKTGPQPKSGPEKAGPQPQDEPQPSSGWD
jgi:recombination protein RecT